MPKVSVIIPIYAVEKYIERCACSLFEQSLEDIEYIFVNDCTPDKSIEILKNIIKKYPHRAKQIKIICHEENKGLPQARRTGILNATGDYLIHCDSDDWLDRDAYKIMWEKAREGNFDIVFCDLYSSNGNISLHHKRNFGALNNKEDLLLTVVAKVLWSVCGALVKRSLLDNPDIIYPTSNNFEDLVLMVQMITNAQKFAHVPKPLYYYYFNHSSMSKSIDINNILKRYSEECINVKIVLDFLKNNQYKNLDDISILLKLKCRFTLSKITTNLQYRKLWFSTYPEIDKICFIFNKNIPLSYKIHYWSVRLRLFTILKGFQNWLKPIK